MHEKEKGVDPKKPHRYQSNGASRDPCCVICGEEYENKQAHPRRLQK